jgi:CRP-like cAMP-binding protein
MAQKTDPATVLKSVPLFGALSRGELNDIADLAREEMYSPGQDIVTEGQSGGPFFCIIEGRAELVVHDKKVRELGPGSYFGEMSLFEGGLRTATVRAQTHVKALAITSWNFLTLLQDNWEITKKVLAELSRIIHQLQEA